MVINPPPTPEVTEELILVGVAVVVLTEQGRVGTVVQE